MAAAETPAGMGGAVRGQGGGVCERGGCWCGVVPTHQPFLSVAAVARGRKGKRGEVLGLEGVPEEGSKGLLSHDYIKIPKLNIFKWTFSREREIPKLNIFKWTFSRERERDTKA